MHRGDAEDAEVAEISAHRLVIKERRVSAPLSMIRAS